MQITHVTYAKVAAGLPTRSMSLRPHEAGVDAFLADHLTELRRLATSNASPLAVFTSDAAKATFEALRDGDDETFLTAAAELTAALIGAMDGRSASGLLVCVRAVEGDVVWAAALKLEVVTEHAARLEQVDRGDLSLTAVTDVVDAPGDLQKGALVEDPRADSDVVIGDRLAQDAAYFPRAFGIRPEQRATETASALVSAVDAHDQLVASRLVRVLPEIPPGSTAEVLRGAAEALPELADMIDDVTNELAARARPVHRVDTKASVRAVINADGVTITAAAASLERVRIENDPVDGWRIVIRANAQPRVSYTR